MLGEAKHLARSLAEMLRFAQHDNPSAHGQLNTGARGDEAHQSMSHRSNRTVALTTLGCKVNQADSDAWLSQFLGRGYEIVDFDKPADVYVVNTCTVTHVADRKSRHLLRQARRQNPAALVVATGCYASVAPDELARLAEVDLIVGDRDKPRLVDLVHDRLEGEDEQPVEALGEVDRVFGARHRGFVKISDGCDKFCAFCIVPYARGRLRSAASDHVVDRVQSLVEAGVREVVLTAVHMGTYGQDLEPPTTLRRLVRRVLDETGVERLRLSSIEPEDFDDGLLPLFSDPRMCRHFHLALDSGCDATLRRMRRRYVAADYAGLLRRIRAAVADVAITTDVMVGFPGETGEEFATSRAFVEAQDFAAIHVFPYSSRRRTTASKLPGHVDPLEKHRRTEVMLELAARSARLFRERFLGRTLTVLYEGSIATSGDAPTWTGLTDNYLRVRVRSDAPLTNLVVATRLDGVGDDALEGTLVGPVPAAQSAPRPGSKGFPIMLTSVSR
jgi:threonylcarbamoyladenosine tRNA methylthiotransferase MtaB